MRKLLNQSSIDPDTELNEMLLRQIAGISGGRYFRAHDSNSLESIYQTLDRLQPLEIATRLYRPQRSLFAWPLGIGMAVLLAFMAYQVYRTKENTTT